MSIRGGRSRFRTRTIGSAALSLVVGWLAISLVMPRVERDLIAAIPNEPAEVIDSFRSRLPGMTDPNRLLTLGARLADHDEPDLAVLALMRAQALIPESRDINYLLAWELYRTMEFEVVAGLEPTTRAEFAERALATAAAIDPLHPGIRELQTIAEQLTKTG